MTTLVPLAEGKGKWLYQDDAQPERLLMRFKDQLTAYNAQKVDNRPGKGAVTAQLSALMMARLAAAGLPTCYLAPGPADNELWVAPLTMLPLEIIVRNRAQGSLLQRYPFLQENQALTPAMVEYCYKNDALGDPPVPASLIAAMGWLPKGVTMAAVEALALAANTVLSQLADEAGLILVDFKLEMGLAANGQLTLGDELSGDTCRFRDRDTGDVLDKDVFRKDLGDVLAAYQALYRRLSAVGPAPAASLNTYTYTVQVAYKPNVLHPESKTILQALQGLGFTQVTALQAGRQFTLTVQAATPAQAEAVVSQCAQQVLSNPVIEAYSLRAVR